MLTQKDLLDLIEIVNDYQYLKNLDPRKLNDEQKTLRSQWMGWLEKVGTQLKLELIDRHKTEDVIFSNEKGFLRPLSPSDHLRALENLKTEPNANYERSKASQQEVMEAAEIVGGGAAFGILAAFHEDGVNPEDHTPAAAYEENNPKYEDERYDEGFEDGVEETHTLHYDDFGQVDPTDSMPDIELFDM